MEAGGRSGWPFIAIVAITARNLVEVKVGGRLTGPFVVIEVGYS